MNLKGKKVKVKVKDFPITKRNFRFYLQIWKWHSMTFVLCGQIAPFFYKNLVYKIIQAEI